MEVTLGLLADAANKSADGKLNILGIFDTIFAVSYPTSHPQCVLVIRYRSGPADRGQTKDLGVQFRDEDGGLVFELKSRFAIPEELPILTPSFDNVLLLGGLPLAKAGRYEFTVTVNGEPKCTIPVTAELIAPDGPG